MAIMAFVGLGRMGMGTASRLDAASPQVIRDTRRMADARHERPVSFTPQLHLKDIEYALALARKLGAGAPFGMLSAEWFRELCALAPEGVNESAVIEVARRQRM